VVLTWLCRSGRAATVDEALRSLRRCRPQVLVSPALLAAVAAHEMR
jgi:protein-tyrosine phosphatase